MSRLLLVAALALLAIPAATAQSLPGATPTASVTLAGIPPGAPHVNGTSHAFDVQVTLELANLACAGQGNIVFPVQLEAKVGNGTGAMAEPKPATLEFQVPPGVQFVQGYSQTLPATLVVTRTSAANQQATVSGTLTATLSAASSGCSGAGGVPSASATTNFTVVFDLPKGVQPADTGDQMPGPEAGLFVAALGALAIALRRRA